MGTITFLLFCILIFIAGWQLGVRSQRDLIREELNRVKQELRRELGSAQAAPQAAPAPAAAPAKADPVVPPAAAPTRGETITDPHTIAVLAATVAAYLGKQVRIRHARSIDMPGAAHAWAQAGRVSIQGSHILNKR